MSLLIHTGNQANLYWLVNGAPGIVVHTVWYFHLHDGVIKWKYFPRYWSFVRGIHRSPVNSPHKGQWRGALMFSLIWTGGWANNRDAGDLRRHCSHYDVTVMHVCVFRPLDFLDYENRWTFVAAFGAMASAIITLFLGIDVSSTIGSTDVNKTVTTYFSSKFPFFFNLSRSYTVISLI